MTDATDLFEAVKLVYDVDGLVTLTNIRDRSKTTITESVGDAAAQSVIDLWPAYAEVAYQASNALHEEAAILGVIAILWRRGGTSSEIEQVKWDEVFGTDGVISRIRRTGPRGRRGPSTNSNLTQATGLTTSGRKFRPWADDESLPLNFLPNRRTADFNN